MTTASPWREDLITGLLSTTLVAGIFLDGWNHINLQNGALGSFFTIWHALLYTGFTATFVWIVTRNPHLFVRGVAPAPYLHRFFGIPLRYPLAMAGFVIAMVGVFGDLLWHTEFGEENGVARVVAPFHLLLFAGAAALVSAGLRSGWYAPRFYPRETSFARLFPTVLSLTLVTCVAAFMFQWLSAFLDWTPSLQLGRMPPSLAADIRVNYTAQFVAVARVLATNVILFAPLFLVLRRWHLPFGSATFLVTVVWASMSALTSFDLGATIAAGLVGGLLFDAVITVMRPDAGRTLGYRVAAMFVPLAMWLAYFAILWSVYGVLWPFDVTFGTIGLAAVSTVLLSYVAISPAVPVSVADTEAHASPALPANAVVPPTVAPAPIVVPRSPVAVSDAAPAASGYSRRSFLRGVGLGVGAATAVGVGAGAAYAATHPTLNPNNFSRMFPDLMPFFHDLIPVGATDQLREALRDMGKQGGPLDAKDALDRGPVALIADASVNGNTPPTNPDNPTHTAGVTFFGQFMDLDITFDARSTLGVPTDPYTTQNLHPAAFDLDTVYGLGPFVTPQYYEKDDPVKLRIESGGVFEDLPRNSDLMPLVPDPRTDQHMMIGGLHCAFILFHNKAVDYARQTLGLVDPQAIFAEAKRLTLWHYHWMILNEFLPLFVGPAMVDDALSRGRRFYRPDLGLATMPIEFQGACFRIGHTMIRPSYRANLKGDQGKPFFGLIFDPSIGDTPAPGVDPGDLRGGFRAPRRFIGWQTFFNFNDGDVKPNKQMDPKISTPLFTLPLGAIASHKAPIALMQRNLLRHVTWSMPSGQSIARSIGADVLTAQDLRELAQYDMGLERNTPLFYYMLKEAALVPDTDIGKNTGGFHLGPVGGRIVAEVVIGLLQSDPASYLVQQPGWVPTLQKPGTAFRMTDFLTFAGVDPVTRHTKRPDLA